MGFRAWLRGHAEHLQVLDISGGYGVNASTFERVVQALQHNPLYSVDGGNRAIVDAFAALGRELDVFIGHDLDEENRQLLEERKVAAIFDHNLQIDARNVFLHILQYHRVWKAAPLAASQVQIVTPFNLPM